MDAAHHAKKKKRAQEALVHMFKYLYIIKFSLQPNFNRNLSSLLARCYASAI